MPKVPIRLIDAEGVTRDNSTLDLRDDQGPPESMLMPVLPRLSVRFTAEVDPSYRPLLVARFYLRMFLHPCDGGPLLIYVCPDAYPSR